jgi:hypothetical protein
MKGIFCNLCEYNHKAAIKTAKNTPILKDERKAIINAITLKAI